MPKTRAATTTFDPSQFERPQFLITREIDRPGREPLIVELKDLSVAETNAIPYSDRLKVADVFQVIAPYVVGWNLRLVNKATGELADVPPPAEAGWEVLELLSPNESGDLISWLKWPQTMETLVEKKRAAEEARKREATTGSASGTSTTTPTRPKPAT